MNCQLETREQALDWPQKLAAILPQSSPPLDPACDGSRPLLYCQLLFAMPRSALPLWRRDQAASAHVWRRAAANPWLRHASKNRQLTEDWHRLCQNAPPALTTQQKAAITAAAADLPGLWAAPSTTDADRKEVIRAVIDEITIAIRGRSELVDVTVSWAGGQQTHEVIRRPIQRSEDLGNYPHLAGRITELAGAG